MNETTANSALITFAIYLLGVFFLAWLSSRVRRKKEFVGEYFLGGRSLGLWAFALTFAATSSSGGSFMGFPSLVYTHGWVLALWIASYMLVPLVGMGLLGKRVNRLARQSGAVTIPDLIKARFRSESVGMIATLLVLFFMFFYLLAQFKAGSKIMTTLLQDVAIYQSAVNAIGGAIDGLPWIGNAEPDYVLCLLVFAFSVIVYTAFGGFRAVVWTDVMQGIVMGIGVPSYQDFVVKNRIKTQASEIRSSLAMARIEAIRRGLRVRVCPGQNGCDGTGNWHGGWNSFVDRNSNDNRTEADDETHLEVHTRLDGGSTLMGAANVIFRSDGTAVVARTLNLCSANNHARHRRQINVSNVGRVRVCAPPDAAGDPACDINC